MAMMKPEWTWECKMDSKVLCWRYACWVAPDNSSLYFIHRDEKNKGF